MRKVFLIGLAIAIFTSCDKNDSNLPAEKANYFPLKVGNYWIYNLYDIDTLGVETKRNETDSLVITKDTIINGIQYFILEGTKYAYYIEDWEVIGILRDSSGYIVNETGEIKFSEDNFTDIFAYKAEIFNDDTIYIQSYQMKKVSDPVTVPAGEFEVLNYKGSITTPENTPGIDNPRYLNNLYAKDVGKVLSTHFYLRSPITTERRLVRYGIIQD